VTGSTDRYDHLLHELAEERVAALKRIARHLEQRLDALKELRAALNGAGGEVRVALLRRYRELRLDALHYRWYLDVQREALGLRPHETVDQYYSVPGPLDA
jgi:hypothetical protein